MNWSCPRAWWPKSSRGAWPMPGGHGSTATVEKLCRLLHRCTWRWGGREWRAGAVTGEWIRRAFWDGGVGTAGDEARAVGETLGAVGECADHPGMPVGERGGVGGSGREVVFFTGIVAETEELLGGAGGAPEVFVATVGEGGEGLGGALRCWRVRSGAWRGVAWRRRAGWQRV